MLRACSEKAFGLIEYPIREVLPVDWNGRVRVVPSIVVNDGYLLAHVYGREPTHWRVFVQCQNGKYEWLETCTTKAAADTLVDRLAVIDVYSKEKEHERVAAFVRTHEKQPRYDKDSLAAKPAVADNTVQEQQQQQDVALPSITVSEKYGSIYRISRKRQRNTPQVILLMGIALFLGTKRKSVGMQGLVLTLRRSNNGCLAMKPSQQI